MQVVSVENADNNQFRLVKLNENLQLQQFDNKMYASEKEAMNNAYSNNSIAKIVSHQDMLNAANHQNLESIAKTDNLKYPHVQILNSDNEFRNQEERRCMMLKNSFQIKPQLIRKTALPKMQKSIFSWIT